MNAIRLLRWFAILAGLLLLSPASAGRPDEAVYWTEREPPALRALIAPGNEPQTLIRFEHDTNLTQPRGLAYDARHGHFYFGLVENGGSQAIYQSDANGYKDLTIAWPYLVKINSLERVMNYRGPERRRDEA